MGASKGPGERFWLGQGISRWGGQRWLAGTLRCDVPAGQGLRVPELQIKPGKYLWGVLSLAMKAGGLHFNFVLGAQREGGGMPKNDGRKQISGINQSTRKL